MKKCSVKIHETKTKCGQPAPWTHPRYKGGFCNFRVLAIAGYQVGDRGTPGKRFGMVEDFLILNVNLEPSDSNPAHPVHPVKRTNP